MKQTLNPEYDQTLQDEVASLVDSFIQGNRLHSSCGALVLALLGEDAHMASDEIYEMKRSFMDLLTFLADPEISAKFAAQRDHHSKNHAIHLKRMLWFLDLADSPLVTAEMAKEQLSIGYMIDVQRLNIWREEFAIQAV